MAIEDIVVGLAIGFLLIGVGLAISYAIRKRQVGMKSKVKTQNY